MISAATALLLACRATGVTAVKKAKWNAGDGEYEAKIQHALSHHAAKSPQLLERSLEEGGSGAAFAVGPDGTVSSSTGDDRDVGEELWQAEFAIQALEEELRVLRMARGASGVENARDNDDDSSDDDESDYEDSSDDDYNKDSDDDNPSGDDGDDGDDEDAETELLPADKAILKRIKDPRYRTVVYNNLIKEIDLRDEIRFHNYSWDELSYWELHASFTCHRVMAGNRPVYDAERWRRLRDFYNEFVADDLKKDPIAAGDPPRTYKFSEDSFDAPTDPFGVEEVADDADITEEDEEKGRGLRAARDIGKGELVFKATNNTVVFNVGYTWRDFLLAMYKRPGIHGEPHDAETTCDFMVWSWIQRLEEDGPLVIVNDMDNGSLLNEGRFGDPDYDDPNVRCGKEGDKVCLMSYYALRDIKKGEELLCDYKDFALIWSWGDMGV